MAPFFGWRVVAAAFVVAVFGWGFGFYGPAIYLHAVVERTGWSVALVSGAVTLHFLAGAAVVPGLPRLYRSAGLPRVTLVGAVLLALGVIGWALAAEPWQLLGAALASGAGWVTLGAAAINAMVSPWFVRKRPAALSMAYNGASIGGVIFSPLWVALIAGFGFPLAALGGGLVMVAAVALLAFGILAWTPAGKGQLPDGDAPGLGPALPARGPVAPLALGKLRRDRRFATLAGGMALGLFAQIGLIAHLVSVLAPVLGAQAAGLLMGAATASAIVGRTLVGYLMPEGADRRLVACLSYGVQAIGSLVVLASGGADVPLLVVGVLLFGSGIGNATSLPPLIAQAEFAASDVARVVPLIVAIGQATYAFAPATFGVLRSLPAGSGALFLAAALVQAAAILCMLAGRRR